MASCLLTEDLTCSICLNIFNDPVTLQCGHSFCRECMEKSLAISPRCPQCSLGVVKTKAHDLPTTFILKSLAEKARGGQIPEVDKVQAVDLCPEHEEKLKLFCFTDHQLTCIICRDSERHDGHKFKPVKEAEAVLRKELEGLVQRISSDITAVEGVAHQQQEEITKNKEKSDHLMTQISNQFKEMRNFLTKRENEIKIELKQKQEADMARLNENLSLAETTLSVNRELLDKANSTLSITEPEKFLKTWSEVKKNGGGVFRPRAQELRVKNTSFSLGPYESHLQFFVWKQMLEVIQVRAEQLSLTNNSGNCQITNSGRSLIYCDYNVSSKYRNSSHSGRAYKSNLFTSEEYYNSSHSGQAYSSQQFTSGEHYWEVDVESRAQWTLGAGTSNLQCNGQQYTVSSPGAKRKGKLVNKLRNIGLYLNLSSQQLSFYDAGRMSHIDAVELSPNSGPISAYFQINTQNPDYEPITVCWY